VIFFRRWFFLLVFIGTAFSSDKNLTIAVFDLEHDKSVSSSEAQSIRERIQFELHSTGAFAILERSQMELILQEQGFQQSGACDNAKCQVEMGKMLGVDRLVIGSVRKIGALTSMNIQMVSVQTGQVEKSSIYDSKETLDVILQEGSRKVAFDLSGMKGSPEIKSKKSKKWLAWTGGILAVAGAGTTLAILLTQSDESNSPEVIVRGNPEEK
jgi:TolB-like protein